MMKSCLTGFFILIFLCLRAYPQLHFKHYGIGDGFSDNSVRQIIQDKKGFLWFGTLNGLNRYDGNDIRIYKTEPGNPNSLSYSRISRIMEDSYSYIWLSTFNSEIQRFDPRTQKFINLNHLIENYDRTDINSALIETSPGTLWMIMRYGGLVRFREEFDTDHFTVDVLDTTNFLPGNIVHFVTKDDHGSLWIGTDNGLVKLRTDTFSFSNRQNPVIFGTDQNLSFMHTCRTEKQLFFSTGSDGLYVKELDVENKSNEFRHIPLKGTIRGMISGKSEDILVVTENDGVYYLTRNSTEISHFNKNEVLISQGENLDIFLIYADRLGKFWITPGKRGITLFDPQKNSFTYYSLNAWQRESQGDDDKHIFFEDSNNDFWIGIYGGGLFKFDRKTQHFINYCHQPENFYSLSSNYVLSIFEDHSKNLWIGTFQGGLNKTELTHYNFDFKRPVQNDISNTVNEVRSIITDRKGRLWIGTKEGSIYCYDSGGDIIYSIPRDLKNKEYKKSNVYAMLEDNEDNLWIGSKGAGLTKINGILNAENLKESKFRLDHYMNDPENPLSLSNDAVFSLYQDHLGQIWVGTYNGGLDLIEDPLNHIVFRHFVYNSADSSSISDQRIRFITQDSKKNLWIGTSNGLSMIKEKYIGSEEKLFLSFRNDLNDISSLSNSDVFYIHEDHMGRIWIATSGGGLNLLQKDEKSGKIWFSFFDRNKGLPGDVIFSILEDKNGVLWLGTDNGLCKFNPEGKKIENYFAEEGIVDNLFSESTCAIAPWKACVFGQKSGFLSFFPDSIVKDKRLYPVVITDFYLFNERVSPGDKKSILTTSIESAKKLELKYNQNYFSIYYSMLDFMHSERCQYAYYLEGMEDDYNYVGNKRIASYTNIDPGKYTFRVKASNHEGYWNETPVSLVIIITPPFWQRAWFIILLSVLVISMLLGIYFTRINSLKKQQLNLEKLVRQRTSEIEEKNKILIDQTMLLNDTNTKLEERQQYIEEQSEELRAQAEELSEKNKSLRTLNMTKDKFFSIIAHDLKNPFNAVLGFSELLSAKYHKTTDVKKKQYIDIIFDSASKIYKLLENLLQWARSQTETIPFQPEEFLLDELVTLNIELALNQIKEKNLKINRDYSSGAKVFADKNMINTVVRNLLTNAIKFTENGNIDIKIKKINHSVTFKIEDTGTGMPRSKLMKIFEVGNAKSTEGTKGESGTGLGLIICKEFIEKNGGSISAKSVENKGSTFTFMLPSKS
jgi:signal transduction histidine kinase/ligand-binding sensor domain-containing protein